VTIWAIVVVNAVGNVVDESGALLAGVRQLTAEDLSSPGENTTIGVVATDLPLDKAGATRLAQAAHDGLARAVRPAHTAMDGDTFFALSTARGLSRTWPVPVLIGAAVAEAVEAAMRRAVRLARGRGGV